MENKTAVFGPEEAEELWCLEFIEKNCWKGQRDGKEKGSVKYIIRRIKFLQNQRNKLNRQISSLKKVALNG